MGVNCPWWVNKLKEEGCTTGPEVRDMFGSHGIMNDVVIIMKGGGAGREEICTS